MAKQYKPTAVSFDKSLIGLISAYAKATDLTFSEAVRQLCRLGLQSRPEAVYTDPGKEITGKQIVDSFELALRDLEERLDDTREYLAELIVGERVD